MKASRRLLPSVLVLASIGALGTGCKTVVRENVISTINTGFGLSLTENPQTQLYELKAGYIRSQFYSVPTGKRVKEQEGWWKKKDGKEQDGRNTNLVPANRPDLTPEVVSGIRAKSNAQSMLLGMDIAENFAIGKSAVNSAAATAMYISQAEDSATAQAAAEASQQAAVKAREAELLEVEALRSELATTVEGMKEASVIDAAGTKAQLAGLLTRKALVPLLGNTNVVAKKSMLQDALEGEGAAHFRAMQRFEDALNDN